MKDKNIKEIEIQLKIILNKMLYEENEINLETYQTVENDLVSKLSKFKLNEEGVR